jgi:chemotaxis protein methyltransferase CheR
MTEIGIVDIRELIKAVKSKYDYDFSDFALTSFKHKLEKIIIKNNLSNIGSLISKLVKNTEFFDIFLHEISVPSTEMFRDPSLWRWLRDDFFAKATEKILARFKIWVANSVSGGELYSLAILLKEIGILDKVQIISSSFSNKSIEYIKEGRCDLKKIELSKENYKRYQGTDDFSNYYKLDRYYALRDTSLIKNVEFKKQNINFDNSPTNIKLILFRNNLIYFNPSLQDRILRLIHAKLSATGLLIVGTKEIVRLSDNDNVFEAVNKPEGIYKKKILIKQA